jgi:trigger factor
LDSHTRLFFFLVFQKLRDKALAGKQAIFEVEVLEASKRIVPELTDEFAENVRAGLTADGILEELRKAIDTEGAKEFTPARNKAIGEALAEVMDVQVPDTLIANQAREKFAVMMSEMRNNGVGDDEIKQQITPENFGKYKDIVKDDIVRDFKISMATDEIANLEEITVPDYQVEEQMEAIRKDAAENQEEFDEKMIRGKVEATLARQAVMDWLAEQGDLEVEYVTDEFDENLLQKIADETQQREMALADESPEAGVVDAVVEDIPVAVAEPAVKEAKEEPVAATASADDESDEAKAARYAELTLEERAFQILQDIKKEE